jgi:hypothetical protein
LGQVKKVALDQAWKLLQLATANVVQTIENSNTNLAGKDKKTIALTLLSQFYDSVFVVIDIPFVPSVLTPIIKGAIKGILMVMVGASIDALVTTFRQIGIFEDPSSPKQLSVNKKNSKRKKK